MEPNLDDIMPLDEKPVHRKTDRLGLDPETKRKRHLESTWRATNATRIADKALRRLHAGDYKSLRFQARARIDRERGPLPGDPT